MPKVTETANVKVESLRTVSSESGFSLPSVNNASQNSTPTIDQQAPHQKQPEETIESDKQIEANLPDFPASAVNIARLNDSNAELVVPPMSGSKFTNDSFGQGSPALMSAGKPRVHILPPLELLQLKQEKGVPSGIQIGALETDRSHRNNSSMLKEVTESDSQVELRQAAQVTDFQAADDKDSEDYTEDEDEEDQGSPEGLKKAIMTDDTSLSEIKKKP